MWNGTLRSLTNQCDVSKYIIEVSSDIKQVTYSVSEIVFDPFCCGIVSVGKNFRAIAAQFSALASITDLRDVDIAGVIDIPWGQP